MSQTAPQQAGPAGSLARLLATEAELEARLAEARARAQAIVRDAEAQGRARQQELESELVRAAAAIAQRHAVECADRIAVLTRESESELTRYGSVSPARVGELADWVAEQIYRELQGPDGST